MNDSKWRIRRASRIAAIPRLNIPGHPEGWYIDDPNCFGPLSHIFDCRCSWRADFGAAVGYMSNQARAQKLAAIQDGAA